MMRETKYYSYAWYRFVCFDEKTDFVVDRKIFFHSFSRNINCRWVSVSQSVIFFNFFKLCLWLVVSVSGCVGESAVGEKTLSMNRVGQLSVGELS